MTNKEAIGVLKNNRPNGHHDMVAEAVDKAVIALSREDGLHKIMSMQRELDDVIMKDLDVSDEVRLGNCITAMMVECCELANDVRYFKHWSKKGPDMDHAKEELMDVLHFWASIANQMGMTADDVHRAYEAKRQVNFERQRTGY